MADHGDLGIYDKEAGSNGDAENYIWIDGIRRCICDASYGDSRSITN